MLLTHIWISDNRDSARILLPVNSPLTNFLIQGTMPRGFINELLSSTALKPQIFEKVSIKTSIIYYFF